LKRWIVVGVVVLAAAGAFTLWKARSKGEGPRYRTAVVERGSIRSVVSATGTIEPVVQVQVGSQVSGTVSKLYADFNSLVKQGQLLLQLEPSSFRARSAQAEATVARAQAALKESKRQLRRSQELVKDNYVSQADVEAAEVDVDQKQADLKQAEAQLQAASVDLANTTIRAPIDGVVIARSVDVGQTVAASLQAPQLFVIANDLSQMQVETKIDEADIGRIRPGLPVTFTVDAYPEMEFEGNVSQVRLEPIVESGVVTYTTVIRTQNRDLRLRPGMTANVTVLVASKDDVLKVPAAALRFHPPLESGGKRGGTGAALANAGGARQGAGVGGGAMAMGGGDANAATRDGGARAGGGQGGAGGWKRDPPAGDSTGARHRGGMGQRAGGAASDPASDMHARGGEGRWRGEHGGDGGGRGAGGWRAKRGAGADSSAAPVRVGRATGVEEVSGTEMPQLKPGAVYMLRDGKPARVPVMTGLGDGASFEIETDGVKPGDAVIVGLEVPVARNQGLTPPPGMGGPTFRGPGGRGGGGGRPR
jgi:HlyD family secretion protein